MRNIHILSTDKPSRLVKNLQYNTFWLRTDYIDREIQRGVEELQYQNIYITSSDEKIEMGEEVWYLFGNEILKNRKDTKPKSFCKKIILTTDQDLIKDGVQAIDDEFLEWFVKNPSCEKIEIEYSYIAIKISKPSPKIYKIIIPKEEPKIISDWLEQNRNPEIDKQVEMEAEQLSKQETLEEAIERIIPKSYRVDSLNYEKPMEKLNPIIVVGLVRRGFSLGAKWQAEQLYKDDVIQTLEKGLAVLLKRQERMYSEEEMLKMLHKFGFDYIYNYRGEKTIYEWIPEWFEQFKKK